MNDRISHIPYAFHLASAEQNRRMDERTINEFGIDGFTLMEIAGTRAADIIGAHTETADRLLFLCGKGNNGGDALVIARLLSEKGYNSTICMCMGTDGLSEDAQRNLELLRKLEGPVCITDSFDKLDLRDVDLVIDGLFGTGLNAEVRSPIDSYIDRINELDVPVFALDLPSGLEADTGRVLGTCIHADHTLTFGALKAGFFLNQGPERSGRIHLCELPFPNQYREQAAFLIDEEWVSAGKEHPHSRTHKYADGMVYVIAGSEGLTGAATLASRSAWGHDTGAVTLITPAALLDIYEKTLIQIIKKSVGSRDDRFFTPDHLPEAQQILDQHEGVLVLGPGLGDRQETQEFVKRLLEDFKGRVVIDADALKVFHGDGPQQPEDAVWILTPHPGELSRMHGSEQVRSDDFDRMIQSAGFAKKRGVTVLSKGMPSMVLSADGNAFLTGYDTRVFSRAGFGDVLAGMIAAEWVKADHAEDACFRALLNGIQRADNYLNKHGNNPEPLDLI